MEIDKIALGNRIKSIRLERSMNLKEFGYYIDNTSDSIVSRWEKGKSVPNPKRLKMIANAGGITVDELLYGDLSNYIHTIVQNYKANGENQYLRNTLVELDSEGRLENLVTHFVDRVNKLGMSYQDTPKIMVELTKMISDYYDDFANYSLDMYPDRRIAVNKEDIDKLSSAKTIHNDPGTVQAYDKLIELLIKDTEKLKDFKNSLI